jgi:uncharacterized protein (UPF0210 family)
MKIRAVTGFVDPGWPVEAKRIESIGACLKAVKEALVRMGYEVQTLRVATPPPAEMERPVPSDRRRELARQLEAECFVHGIDYCAVGPVLPGDEAGFEVIPKMIGGTENVFTSAILSDPETGLSLSAAKAISEVIQRISTLAPDGFSNLRFAALANVPPGSPFFPAAYHSGGAPALALATESADLAVEILTGANSLNLARSRLVRRIEGNAAVLTRVVEPIANQHELRLLGIDFSLAPYPEQLRSVGVALEGLGLPAIGLPGSLTAVAFLTDSLDKAEFPRTGFCGLFLPVLEDTALAQGASEGRLTVQDLLLYAGVCGAGLDTVPLPGDTPTASLAALLMDLGALSLRQDKPLTARLMPIPEKGAGDEVNFDFPYFAPSRVMQMPNARLEGLLGGSEDVHIGPIHPQR